MLLPSEPNCLAAVIVIVAGYTCLKLKCLNQNKPLVWNGVVQTVLFEINISNIECSANCENLNELLISNYSMAAFCYRAQVSQRLEVVRILNPQLGAH